MSISIHWDIDGLDELIGGLTEAPLLLHGAERAAMEDSVLFLESEIKDRTPVVTGRLRSSWESSVHNTIGGFGIIPEFVGTVGSSVKNDRGYGYSPIVEGGRGPVFARAGGFLRFRIKGVGPWIFRRSVGPAAGVHMAEEGLEESKDTILAIFKRYLQAAIDAIK